jgi:hypothetical protein
MVIIVSDKKKLITKTHHEGEKKIQRLVCYHNWGYDPPRERERDQELQKIVCYN